MLFFFKGGGGGGRRRGRPKGTHQKRSSHKKMQTRKKRRANCALYKCPFKKNETNNNGWVFFNSKKNTLFIQHSLVFILTLTQTITLR